MTLEQLYERIASLPNGGYITVDTRLDRGYMYSLIHSARAFVVNERWRNNGFIPPVYYQSYKPSYIILSQDADSCYTRFYNVPQIIALDGRGTGIGYLGANGTLCQFREVNNRAQMASMMNNRIIRKMRKPIVLVLGSGEMEVYYTDSIEDMRIEAVFADPTSVNTYNVDFDDYPIDMGDIAKIEQLLMAGQFNMISRTPIDRINEQRDTTVLPQTRM